MKKLGKKKVIGRVEKVSFPKLGLKEVLAKVDSGSYRGTLHCQQMGETIVGNSHVLRFIPLDPRHSNYRSQPIEVADYKLALIKNTSGHRHLRYIIKTPIKIDGEIYDVELSLSKRQNMRYPVLLGRKFLKGKFIIDVSRKIK